MRLRLEEYYYECCRIPDSGRPSKMSRYDGGSDYGMMSQDAPSVVRLPGMPPPAQRPRGPKLKFTPEDDQLLVDMKENKTLTWKQIAEFFPGRSSGEQLVAEVKGIYVGLVIVEGKCI
ncbi:hypothetical protein VE03_10247 [Pseudogymnoascus sp. 23342-1-I1]|nr:hypothetical protein VE03_10247 [Pseudogymnoascus sp. 23342-1-I1]